MLFQASLHHPLLSVRIAAMLRSSGRAASPPAPHRSSVLPKRSLGLSSNLAPAVPHCACQLSHASLRLSTAGRPVQTSPWQAQTAWANRAGSTVCCLTVQWQTETGTQVVCVLNQNSGISCSFSIPAG